MDLVLSHQLWRHEAWRAGGAEDVLHVVGFALGEIIIDCRQQWFLVDVNHAFKIQKYAIAGAQQMNLKF